jgi:quercetin dioxygenase-like cupin family protein
MTKVKLIFLTSLGLYLLTAPLALAQTAHKVVRVDDVKWIDHPVFKGAKTAILVGDPTKAEVIVQRTKFPPHYHVPPHTHPYAEVVTVLSGSYGNNFGDKFEPKGELMKPGSLFVLPANHPHYTWTGDEETRRAGSRLRALRLVDEHPRLHVGSYFAGLVFGATDPCFRINLDLAFRFVLLLG